jgi:hypothetical protein
VTQAWEQARHAQSSTRICVEHAIADSKNWRPPQRWTGRREYLPETIQAIGSLVSDRAGARNRPYSPITQAAPGKDAPTLTAHHLVIGRVDGQRYLAVGPIRSVTLSHLRARARA